MSTTAASHLSPAFPDRAPWGTASKLRAWQAEALEQYLEATPRDFLAVATPGAGKTTFALRLATELLHRGVIQRVTVVAPTEHLKKQWADAAAPGRHPARPGASRNAQGAHAPTTTASRSPTPRWPASRCCTGPAPRPRRTLVILDEIHHGGDNAVLGRGHPGGVRAGHPAARA